MQYPVFPWILADYDSEVFAELITKSACFFQIESTSNDGFVDQELDLSNPKTFRNLAKPMGAQTDDRLGQYKKRYKDWEDPNGKTYS